MRISTKLHNYAIAYTWRKSRVNQEVDEVICIKLFQDKDKDQGRMKVKDGRSKKFLLLIEWYLEAITMKLLDNCSETAPKLYWIKLLSIVPSLNLELLRNGTE